MRRRGAGGAPRGHHATGAIRSGDALARALADFDAAAPVGVDDMIGRWRGSGVPTGHPLDGLLETYRWWGKAFRNADDVDPLLFRGRGGRVRALDPWRLPVGLGASGRAPRSALVGRASVWAHPALATRHPRARLRMVEVRGVVSAAMVYDHLPIIDAFRAADADTLLGLMDRRGDASPFCFRLLRDG